MIAGLAVTAGLAIFFYRGWILEKERRRNDLRSIKVLRAMLENRNGLSNDPDAVKRVLDAFAPRPDKDMHADAGIENADGGRAPVPKSSNE